METTLLTLNTEAGMDQNKYFPDHHNYPSKYKIGDDVQLNFHGAGKVMHAVITAIRFTADKVYYDCNIEITPGSWTGIIDIDSCFVEDYGQIEANIFFKASDVKNVLDKEFKKIGEKHDKKDKFVPKNRLKDIDY